MSNIFGVSTDYLLKEEIEEIKFENSSDGLEGEKLRSIFIEDANIYMDLVKQVSAKIGLGVFICILAPICLIIIGGMAEYGKISMTEGMAVGIGSTVLLSLIVVGVGILIWNGMKLSQYEYLEKESFILAYGVKGIVDKKKSDFEWSYRRSIVGGVALCILGVIPIMIAGALEASEMSYVYNVGILLLFVGSGVYLFVWSGMIQASYMKLLQEGDYTQEKKGWRVRYYSEG